MKNNNENDINAFNAAGSSEHVGNGTNMKGWYVVTLCHDISSVAFVRIQADSQEDAEEKAEAIDVTEVVGNWESVNGESWVDSVELYDGNPNRLFSQIVKPDDGTTQQDGGVDND